MTSANTVASAVNPVADAQQIGNRSDNGSNYRFPKRLRLADKTAFDRVFAKADGVAGGQSLTLLAKPNELDYPRIGLVVAKKKVRTAVRRNLFKRLCRENFRQQQHDLIAADYILIAKPAANKAKRSLLNREIKQSLQRVQRKLRKFAKPSNNTAAAQ